jgi:hypothetical protein
MGILFYLRNVFQEQYPGVKQELPLLFLRVSFSCLINFEFFALSYSIPEMIISETKEMKVM